MSTTDHEPSSTPSNDILWERILLASALAAVFLVVLAVGGTALVTKAIGVYRAWTPPVTAVAMLIVVSIFAPWARRGRGPLAAAA